HTIQPFLETQIDDWNDKSNKATFRESDRRWLDTFDHFDSKGVSLQQLPLLMQYLFCLPGHNASVERIFSKIKLFWTAQKSRLSISTVSDFAHVVTNFDVEDSSQM